MDINMLKEKMEKNAAQKAEQRAAEQEKFKEIIERFKARLAEIQKENK